MLELSDTQRIGLKAEDPETCHKPEDKEENCDSPPCEQDSIAEPKNGDSGTLRPEVSGYRTNESFAAMKAAGTRPATPLEPGASPVENPVHTEENRSS